MSYWDYSTAAARYSERRWFDGGPLRLLGVMMIAAALIGGMFLGRFLTQAETHRTLAGLEAELLNKDAEIDSLRYQAMQPPPQQEELDRLTKEHQKVLARLAEIQRSLAVRQDLIEQAIAHAEREHQTCLTELRRYEEARQPLAASDVSQFAEWMFDSRKSFLESLKVGRSIADTAARPVPFPAIREMEMNGAGSSAIAKSEPGEDRGPQLNAQPVSAPEANVYFAPPKRRPGYTFLRPRQSSRVATQSPGIRFSDTAASEDGPVLR